LSFAKFSRQLLLSVHNYVYTAKFIFEVTVFEGLFTARIMFSCLVNSAIWLFTQY